ncbi:efflux RND transporter permease subunit [Gryllotalpicola protaetiae]|uniref:Efflux RND transporter permease subunit n=1 Tax=Gryllotalpicola protaetiae TaxID=2419771 RepID=A0A387BMF2_9MICO|nr:efflux RND transporter permease subunit [Gryllotalpicola protaetiae]AYG03214.1 efflux RND transporter permease subunit [Gryllotalpicola protaetiae]
MHRLAVLSMKNRALIALITICAAVFGGFALTNLKQELIPSVQFPQLAILTTYPGASPAVVSNDVSTPIETAIQGVPGLDQTSAVSSTNQSLITAQFNYGTNLDTAEQKLNQAINQISSALPANVTPQVISASLDDLPVIQIAATGTEDTAKLGDDITRLVLPEIKKVDGVDDAQLIGLAGQRVTITPDSAKLAAAGLSTQAITSALQQNGVLVGAGQLTQGAQTLTVQAGSQLGSVDDITGLPLISGQGADASGRPGLPLAAPAAVQPKTIGDVASVALDTDPTTTLSRVNGEPALTIAVTKLPAANTVAVSDGVKKLIPDLKDKLGGDVKLTTVFDQAPFITQSISSLAEEGLLGLGFAVIVILVFLLSVRSTIVTAISIPTSVLITFIVMWASDYTLNIITLGGLTIAIGRVVDDSIVVIENIKRHLVPGADRAATVVKAVREVAGAITASTITTVAVFAPIAFVGDVTGELFRPFALTVTIALLASLLVALTIVPVLAYWFVRPPKLKPGSRAAIDEQIEAGRTDELEHPTRLQRGYLPIIRWTLRHSGVTVLIAVGVLVGTVALGPLLTTNFLGDSGQNTLTVNQTLPPGASLDAKNDASKPVEKLLRDTKGVEIVQTSVGGSGSAIADAFGGGGSGTTFSVTTDASADQVALQNTIKDELKTLHDVGTVQLASSQGLGGSSDIEIDVTAPNDESLQQASDALVKKLDGYHSLTQVSSGLSADLPYIAVDVDRAKAAQAGLTEVALSQLVSQSMQPTQIGTIAIDQTTLKIYLDNPDAPTTVDQLKALQVPTATGPVALSDLADVHQSTGPTKVTTVKGQRSATITATPASQDLTQANRDVNTALAAVHLPTGATATLGGVQQSQSQAFSQLGLALLAAILIVYIVMVATFKSLRQPLLLLVSVPFAATGAILLQLVSGVPLGVASLIGVLMLIGIVVTNAIVLVDLVNQYRERGMPVPEAVAHGASRRLRPILMTALATICALTPMALGITGHGSFISQPLAIVVIGGLVSSTVLTLVVLPTLYNLVEGARERRLARRAAVTN